MYLQVTILCSSILFIPDFLNFKHNFYVNDCGLSTFLCQWLLFSRNCAKLSKICPTQGTFNFNNFFIITPIMLKCGADISQHMASPNCHIKIVRNIWRKTLTAFLFKIFHFPPFWWTVDIKFSLKVDHWRTLRSTPCSGRIRLKTLLNSCTLEIFSLFFLFYFFFMHWRSSVKVYKYIFESL